MIRPGASFLAMAGLAFACGCQHTASGGSGNGDGGSSTSAATSTGGSSSGSSSGSSRASASSGSSSGTTSTTAAGGSSGCGLRDCKSAKANCGPIGDGCGGTLDCGTCTPPQTCGGGGQPSVCGGTAGCVAMTCADAGANCGPMADGCGHLLQCGSCDAGVCGAGHKPNVCGGTGVGEADGGGRLASDGGCQPFDCDDLGFDCGPAADGCGGLLQCGDCDAGTCGGGGKSGVCGAPPACVPLTCAQLATTCGQIGDGCGNIIGPCGPACTSPDICGGGGVPNQCGDGAAGGNCVNLCLNQVLCPNGGTTAVTGTVYAPTNPALGFGDPDPLPNALVYVPNAPLQAFAPGASCDVCGATASGSPLVNTTSAVDGTFTLDNVPANVAFPIVFQIGRWRRSVTIGPFAPCTSNALTPDQSRLPRNSTEGDIPLIALATGNVDATECVLRKMGIDDSEFTAPGIANPGRVQLWVGNGASDPQGVNAQEVNLTSNATTLDQYDQVIFACWGYEVAPAGSPDQPAAPDQPPAQVASNQQNVIDFANSGGRIFATHFSYVWFDNDPYYASQGLPAGPAPFDGTADWDLNAGNNWDDTCDGPGGQAQCQVNIDQTFAKGAVLAQWLQVVGASSVQGVIPELDYPRWDLDGVVAPSENWLQWPGNSTPLETYTPIHYTFDTPVGAAQQCGRVVFSDFHVENSAGTSGMAFPAECTNAVMTAQEKVLEFMLFDLASCITQPTPPPATCTPLTCPGLNYNCGSWGDGCGNVLPCGTCPTGTTCGGDGQPGVCGNPACTKLTCAGLGYDCGPAGDGCGGELECGGCDAGTCGGGGVPGVCGSDDICTPLDCKQQGLQCGPAGDGCGNEIQCGGCDAGSCGGGGQPGVCGSPNCKPQTCKELGFNCGPAGDGCGNDIQCGGCDGGTCGGGGQPGVCGSPTFE